MGRAKPPGVGAAGRVFRAARSLRGEGDPAAEAKIIAANIIAAKGEAHLVAAGRDRATENRRLKRIAAKLQRRALIASGGDPDKLVEGTGAPSRAPAPPSRRGRKAAPVCAPEG